MSVHDPLMFATGLSAKLASRSRHVCAFLGAGMARACGLPDVADLQTRVLADLDSEARTTFAHELERGNLEQALTRLRRIAALLTGEQTLDGLTAKRAKDLDAAVCKAIIKELDVACADLAPVDCFAAWAARADYRLPLELFTVNYDLLLETALERRRVPYFDGFVGNLRARFHTELVEGTPGTDGEWVPAFFVRLWKLHGSVNWAWEDDKQIVRLGHPITEGRAAAIYPSDTKYEESRRVPFVVLQDRFRRALHQSETLVIVSGYSFNDHHLNELLFDAATQRERSEIVAFCYSDIPDVLVQRATTTPNLQVVSGREAILGGVRGEWKPPNVTPPNLWNDGQLALRDFRNLAAYLARSATREPEGETGLRELLKGAVAERSADTEDKGDG